MKFNMIQEMIDAVRDKERQNLNKTETLFECCYHKKPSQEMRARLGYADIADRENELEIFKKLKTLYKQNKEIFAPLHISDMWQDTYVPSYQNLFNYLEADQDDKALNFLNNMCNNGGTCGFFSGSIVNRQDEKNINQTLIRDDVKFYFMETLVNFAEWLNVIPAESVDLESQGNYIYKEPEYLIELIEKKLGFEIKFPDFQNGLTSIITDKGAFINRHIIYLYIALKIKEFCKDIPQPRICEIGGGVGLLAYYCNLIGLKDVTIIDIPSVSFISSYFMTKNLPERKFIFSDDSSKYTEKNAIKILFPKYFNKAPDNQYDIVINCDSLPEINEEITREYLKNIKRTAKLFYSINHEWHQPELQKRNVYNLVDYVGGFNKKFRNLFWLRRGYVEELYEIQK